MDSRYCLFLLLIITAVTISQHAAWPAQKRYYKGNTHTHCYPWSGDITDATYTGTAIVNQYKARGYDFLVFTDHGAWWNAKGLSSSDFTVINGSEPGISGGGRWGHFTAVNLKRRVSGANLSHQQLIDSIFSQDAIPFLNHPRYSQIPISAAQVIDDMKNNLFHLEIWNGVTANQPPPDDISVWDSVLSTGRLMYGVASDDSHRESNQGKGWIMVYASSNHQDTLIQAIRNGDFYASTGIVLDSVAYSPRHIYVKSRNGETVRFIGRIGAVLASVIGGEGTYSITGGEGYVRADISNSQGVHAWIQPMMVSPSSHTGDEDGSFPTGHALYQNYPNPFNSNSSIRYRIAEFRHVRLVVYDLLGREVKTLVNEVRQPGTYTVEFDGSNLASAIYVYRLLVQPAAGTAAVFAQTRKLLVIR